MSDSDAAGCFHIVLHETKMADYSKKGNVLRPAKWNRPDLRGRIMNSLEAFNGSYWKGQQEKSILLDRINHVLRNTLAELVEELQIRHPGWKIEVRQKRHSSDFVVFARDPGGVLRRLEELERVITAQLGGRA